MARTNNLFHAIQVNGCNLLKTWASMAQEKHSKAPFGTLKTISAPSSAPWFSQKKIFSQD
jgi:hypothetical protein